MIGWPAQIELNQRVLIGRYPLIHIDAALEKPVGHIDVWRDLQTVGFPRSRGVLEPHAVGECEVRPKAEGILRVKFVLMSPEVAADRRPLGQSISLTVVVIRSVVFRHHAEHGDEREIVRVAKIRVDRRKRAISTIGASRVERHVVIREASAGRPVGIRNAVAERILKTQPRAGNESEVSSE